MDKNAIKKYAIWARRELIERVSQRAMMYGISTEEICDSNADSVNGHLLSSVEKRQRQALIQNIQDKGYEQVIEEVAYTWFNRFAAIRFMEVNGYLPSHVRVFTNDADEFKPQILTEAIHLELDGLDMEKVYELENDNKSEELFKYLLIVQCNALNSILPGMFQRIEDYTELLLPDYLLREGSVIEQMVTCIPEEDWTDQVQIIGWLYQYYNTEPKDKVFADLKNNIKITKEKIPAATQLFTPDWIVHYMVENSLGRLWLEGHPNDELKSEWKYYLDEAEQEPEVKEQLSAIQKEYATLKPEEIRVIVPCMGSGHMLCVLFDVLVRIYEDYGYTSREAAVKIVENNLWGLDIDERAAQLSYFAVMMKARQYDRRFFTRKVQPHVYAIEESNGITSEPMHDMGLNLSQEEYVEAVKQAMQLVEEMHDAKEYGSIIHVTPCNWDLLRRFAVPREEKGQLHLDIHGEIESAARLQCLINIGEALAQKYDVVVTNPPYMGSSGMNAKLGDYVKKNYPDSKGDLFAVFIERGFMLTKLNGYESMITMESWMFLSSFEKLRSKLMQSKTIKTFVHMPYLGKGGTSLGINFGTDMAVIQNRHIKSYVGIYDRIVYYETDDDGIPFEFPTKNDYYKQTAQDIFAKIPGSPVAYWVTPSALECFAFPHVSDYGATRNGMTTGSNDTFMRSWYEVSAEKSFYKASSAEEALESGCKWFPYNKGGELRKWYGNFDFVLNWEEDGRDLKNANNSILRNRDYYFRDCITWSLTNSGGVFGARIRPCGSLFDVNGMSLFLDKDRNYVLAILNSHISSFFMRIINPTMANQAGNIDKIPVIIDEINRSTVELRANQCIEISKNDWDSFEISWDFQRHPMVTDCRKYTDHLSLDINAQAQQESASLVSSRYEFWNDQCEQRFQTLKANEEELNRIFINVYGLQDELAPEVRDKDVTIRRANLPRDIKSLISYAVGCMLGRYSLDTPGLAYAGGEWDASKYSTFLPDADTILPICDDEYFEDDIVGRFVSFIEVVYGKKTLEQNLRFIADALGGKGASRDVIRNYFINDFYADHLKVYQKRPIYWLFDSGKKNGFKCLIYMHRYQPDTIAKIRTDYVHEQQSRYRTAIADLEQRVENTSGSERVKLTKQLTKLQDQAEEVRVYEEKIHHLADQMIEIDLDDGVKHNYALFKDVLAKIK